MQQTPRRILVVDDDPAILEFLQIILTDEGYEVAISEKGEVLEHLDATRHPHLILIDMLLSGKDARDIVKQLKGQEETRHIPVIMMSAHPSARETTQQVGAEEFLAKPFDIEELLERIARCI